ncbi:hypothetical protein [Bacteroides fragilis]|uniref:hypothetical protein n=1 Tax=Bacteroides fragilis TaxID=817 RepID=UPI0022E68B09|nr:hypothetical protein [Bacteroides fragilis]
MKPKKQLIETAVKDGSIDRMNMLLSAAHLLNCEANSLIEEASDVDFVKCADRYFREFATLVTTDKSKMDMFGDLDGFDKSFREWAKVPADWEPQNME